MNIIRTKVTEKKYFLPPDTLTIIFKYIPELELEKVDKTFKKQMQYVIVKIVDPIFQNLYNIHSYHDIFSNFMEHYQCIKEAQDKSIILKKFLKYLYTIHKSACPIKHNEMDWIYEKSSFCEEKVNGMVVHVNNFINSELKEITMKNTLVFSIMAGVYVNQIKYKKAIEMYKKSVSIAWRLGNYKVKASFYEKIAKIFHNHLKDMDSFLWYSRKAAEEFYNSGKKEKAFKIYKHIIEDYKSKKIKERQIIGKCYKEVALMYHEEGYKKQATLCIKRAIKIFKNFKNKESQSTCYQILASIYEKEEGWLEKITSYFSTFFRKDDAKDDAKDDPIKNYKKAFKLTKKPEEKGKCKLNIGNHLFRKKKKYKDALKNYMKASNFFSNGNCKVYLAKCSYQIALWYAKMYKEKDNVENSLIYFKKALKIFSENNMYQECCVCFINFERYYRTHIRAKTYRNFAEIYKMMAEVYKKNEINEKAGFAYRTAGEVFVSFDKNQAYSCFIWSANAFLALNRYDFKSFAQKERCKSFVRAANVAEKIGLKKRLLEIYPKIAYIYRCNLNGYFSELYYKKAGDLCYNEGLEEKAKEYYGEAMFVKQLLGGSPILGFF